MESHIKAEEVISVLNCGLLGFPHLEEHEGGINVFDCKSFELKKTYHMKKAKNPEHPHEVYTGCENREAACRHTKCSHWTKGKLNVKPETPAT